MDRGKEKIIEYAIIAGIGVALFAAILAFNDVHTERRIPGGLQVLERVRAFAGLDANPAPAPTPMPSNDPCRTLKECGVHFVGGVRG